jgi:pyrroline-5-carboxylate reductase
VSGVEQRVRSRAYGVLGVGAIAEAIVTGLCDGVDDAPEIVLSPRNRERAAALSTRFASVVVARDNQAVVDSGAVVLICIRPQDAAAVLERLAFSADTTIVSTIAGVSIARLRELVGPVSSLSRAIPLPAVRDRAGITPLYPPTNESRQLFDALGRSVAVADERVFDASSAATATIRRVLSVSRHHRRLAISSGSRCR